jgi:hypothetical protein
MADIFDITVASMKLGVAVPVPNHSFKYWDDPGTWADPSKWTPNNSPTIARNYTGFDDYSAVQISKVSAPADNTTRIESVISRIWNDNAAITMFSATMNKYYYSIAAYVSSLSGGGGDPGFKAQLVLDTAEAFPSPSYGTLFSINSQTSELVLNTGAVTHAGAGAGDKWAQVMLIVRDATTVMAVVDNVGVMFDPFDNNGYTELTNVFSSTPPGQDYRRYTKDAETRHGTTVRTDDSGGGEKLALRLHFENESLATYETLKRYYDLNHGTPGLPGLPLLIEPNLPGYPPTFMCNIPERPFPINQVSQGANRYGGSITFVGVWA